MTAAARAARPSGPSPWTLAGCALAAVSCAAALTIGRAVRGSGFVFPLIGAAVLPHVLGAGLRSARRGAAVRVLVSAIALVVYATWVVVPETAVAGIPGPGALHALAQAMSDGWGVYRTGAAPVPLTDGVLFLGLLGAWIVATTADELAFGSWRASVGALVPGLSLFAIASTLGKAGLRVLPTIAFLATSMVFLLAQHQAFLEERRSWFTGAGRSSRVLALGALLGGGALVVGLVVAPALPGATAGAWLDYRHLAGARGSGAGSYETRVNPLVDLRDRLVNQTDTELFRVQTRTAALWRIVALDRFDGARWTLRARSRAATDVLARRAPAGAVRQRFALDADLGERWLPAAYEPVAIDLSGTQIVPESRTLVASSSTAKARYTVFSSVPPLPTPTQIDATAAPVPARLRAFTALPSGFPASVRARAERITADAPNAYARAKALEAFFLDGSFTYDVNIPPLGDADPIQSFLESRRGFCEQFAGAFAAMARAVGLPTRVAVGFTAGTYDSRRGTWTVTGRDAHAWPEVWLAGLGWRAFEPTPAGTQPGATQAGTGTPTPTAPPSAPTTPTTVAPALPVPTTATSPAPSGEIRVLPSRRPRHDDTPLWVLPAIGGVAALLLLGRLAAGRAGDRRRRTRARRDPDPRRRVVGAWSETVRRLRTAGIETRPDLTPREVASRAPEAVSEPLDDLATAVDAALWAAEEPDERSAALAWELADTVHGTLRAERRRASVPVRSG